MSNRKLKLAGYIFLVAAAIACMYYWLRPNRLASDASSMAEAVRIGDGTALLNFAGKNEIECSELTPERIHNAWKILIEPLIGRSKPLGQDKIEPEPGDTQAVATYRFKTDGGDPWAIDMIANQSDDGSKAIILYPMICAQSMFDDSGHANPTLTSELALKGVRRVRERLEAIGIHRIALGPRRCLTWNELETSLEQGASKSRS
jgi:hypothetical protein